MAAAVTTTSPALTTVFTPAPSCLVDIWQYSATNSGLDCYVDNTQVQCNYVQLGPSTTTSCFPSGWNYDSTAYFSPGICPSGYATACSSVTTIGTNTETRATCCPSGYSCQTATDWPWYSTDPCTYTNPGPVTYAYTTSVPGAGVVTTTVTTNEGFNAYGVQIRFQESDSVTALTATTASTSTTSTSGSAQTTASPASTAGAGAGSTASPTNSGTSPGGLSTGAKAGIGVGVAIAAIIIITAILFFLLRRRPRGGNDLASRAGAGTLLPTSGEVAQLPGSPAKVELHSNNDLYSELHGNSLYQPAELESGDVGPQGPSR